MVLRPTVALGFVLLLLLAGCGTKPPSASPRSLEYLPTTPKAPITLVFDVVVQGSTANPIGPERHVLTLLYNGTSEVFDEWGRRVQAHGFTREFPDHDGKRPQTLYLENTSRRYLGKRDLWNGLFFHWVDQLQGPFPNGPLAAAFLLLQAGDVRLRPDANLSIADWTFRLDPLVEMEPGRDECRWHQLNATPRLQKHLDFFLCLLPDSPPAQAASANQHTSYTYTSRAPLPQLHWGNRSQAPESELVHKAAWTEVRDGNLLFRVPPVTAAVHEVAGASATLYRDLAFRQWVESTSNQAYLRGGMWWWSINPIGNVTPLVPGLDHLYVWASDGRTRYTNTVFRFVPPRENTPGAYGPGPFGQIGTAQYDPTLDQLSQNWTTLADATERLKEVIPAFNKPGGVFGENWWHVMPAFVQEKAAKTRRTYDAAYWGLFTSCVRNEGGQFVTKYGLTYAGVTPYNGQMLTHGPVRAREGGCGWSISWGGHEPGWDDEAMAGPVRGCTLDIEMRLALVAPLVHWSGVDC